MTHFSSHTHLLLFSTTLSYLEGKHATEAAVLEIMHQIRNSVYAERKDETLLYECDSRYTESQV